MKKAFSLSNAITSTYILDQNYSYDFNAKSRAWFLGNSLRELSQNWKNLGSRLIIDEGNPLILIPKLAKLIDAKIVVWNKTIEPYEINRDLEIKNTLKKFNIKRRYDNSSNCLLYTSPSPRDVEESRMPSSA